MKDFIIIGLCIALLVAVGSNVGRVQAQAPGVPFVLHLGTGPSSSCPPVTAGDTWICATSDLGVLASVNGAKAFTIGAAQPANFTQLDCGAGSFDAAGFHAKPCTEK